MSAPLCPACKKLVADGDGTETDAGIAHKEVCAGYFNAVWPGTRVSIFMPAPDNITKGETQKQA